MSRAIAEIKDFDAVSIKPVMQVLRF